MTTAVTSRHGFDPPAGSPDGLAGGPPSESPWTPARLAAAALLAAGAVLAMFGPWRDMAVTAYTQTESGHILLVPAVVGWLVWVRRDRLRACRVESAWGGPALVALGWAVSHFGFYHSVQSLWHAGAVLALVGSVVTVLGVGPVLAVWPAVVALVFLVPVPQRVRFPIANDLQIVTARVTASVLAFFGEAVTRSGNQLVVRGTPVLVAEACNGMRGVFSLFLVVYVFCFSLPLRGGVRALLIALSPITAGVCNVVRIIPVAWLYGHASAKTAEAFHDVSGWLMVPVAFVLLMGVLKILGWMKISVMKGKGGT